MASCSGQPQPPRDGAQRKPYRSKNVKQLQALSVPGDNNRTRKSMTNTCKSGEKESEAKGVSSYKPEEPARHMHHGLDVHMRGISTSAD
jgi:hypothetical protein